jgi:hypothetical protein
MPTVGFEPAIPVIERPQTYVLDHTATGIRRLCICTVHLCVRLSLSVADRRTRMYQFIRQI